MTRPSLPVAFCFQKREEKDSSRIFLMMPAEHGAIEDKNRGVEREA